MFSVKKYENMISTYDHFVAPILPLIGPHRSQIVFKTPMVLVRKANLGIILPFTVDYST